eukprot:COSAG02_NODE_62627_length_265_cov_0.909639_1_plen_70_part_01
MWLVSHSDRVQHHAMRRGHLLGHRDAEVIEESNRKNHRDHRQHELWVVGGWHAKLQEGVGLVEEEGRIAI